MDIQNKIIEEIKNISIIIENSLIDLKIGLKTYINDNDNVKAFSSMTVTDYYNSYLDKSPNIFYSKKIPKIKIEDYILRINKYIEVEYGTLSVFKSYLNIISEKININSYNCHKIVLTAYYLAYKFNEDYIYDNNYYAKAAGIKVSELIMLEFTFLESIDYKLFIKH